MTVTTLTHAGPGATRLAPPTAPPAVRRRRPASPVRRETRPAFPGPTYSDLCTRDHLYTLPALGADRGAEHLRRPGPPAARGVVSGPRPAGELGDQVPAWVLAAVGAALALVLFAVFALSAAPY